MRSGIRARAHWIFIMLLMTSTLLLGCATDSTVNEVYLAKEMPERNFILYVSNLSNITQHVDMSITLDGEEIISDTFPIFSWNVWKQYEYRLTDGEHCIAVKSVVAKAEHQECFNFRGRKWALLYFLHDEYGGPRFTFEMRNEPIVFE